MKDKLKGHEATMRETQCLNFDMQVSSRIIEGDVTGRYVRATTHVCLDVRSKVGWGAVDVAGGRHGEGRDRGGHGSRAVI